MSDEAIVRIVLQDQGGASPSRTVSAPTGTGPSSAGLPSPSGQQQQSTPTNAPSPSGTTGGTGRDWVDHLIKGIEGANRHVLIEGQSGSGKSVLTRHIAFQRMKQGEDVHVVDTHNPESWGGAKQVFQGQRAGIEAAEFMRDLLIQRKREASDAKTRGEMPDFKPVTVVLSDFARLAKDTPELQKEFKTLLTEARKFRISIVADTTALTAAATGIKGIIDVQQNFGQRVKMYGPSADDPNRRAIVGGEEFQTPVLPDYKDRVDYGLVKPSAETDLDVQVGPAAEARRRLERERYKAQVDAEYAKLTQTKPDETSRIVEVTKQFRGAVDGFVGVILDSALNLVDAFQKAQVNVKNTNVRVITDTLSDSIPTISDAVKSIVMDLPPPPPPPSVEEMFPVPDISHIDQLSPFEIPKNLTSKQWAKDLADLKSLGSGNLSDELAGAETLDVDSSTAATANRKAGETSAPGLGGTTMVPSKGAETMAPNLGEGTKPASPPTSGGMDLAGLAGAAGIALAAKAVVDTVGKAAVDVVSGVGNTVAGMVDPNADAAGSVMKMGQAARKTGETIAQVSPALGYMAQAAGAATESLGALMHNLDAMAQRYGEYSPDIALAQGVAEMRHSLGEMRRAQEAGPELARYVQIQSDLQQKFEDTKIRIMGKILEVVNPILTALEGIMPAGEVVAEGIGAALAPLKVIAEAAAQLVNIQRDDRLPDVSDPTSLILNWNGGQGTTPGGTPLTEQLP